MPLITRITRKLHGLAVSAHIHALSAAVEASRKSVARASADSDFAGLMAEVAVTQYEAACAAEAGVVKAHNTLLAAANEEASGLRRGVVSA